MVRVIKERLYYLYHIFKRSIGKIFFRKNSVKSLIKIQNIFKKELKKYDFFFAFGTLLGIVRDNKLFSRDMDIDMAVFVHDKEDIKNIRSVLRKNNAELLHYFVVEKYGITQDSFLFNNVMVDINYIYNGDNRLFLLYDLPEEKNKVLYFGFSAKESEKRMFQNIHINVPANPEMFLEEVYGEDWRIPNPHYIYWENKMAKYTSLKGKIKKNKKFPFS